MTQIQPEEIGQLEALAAIHRDKLRVLERQLAALGPTAPAAKLLERDQALQDLENVQRQLRRLRPPAGDERPPYVGLGAFQEGDRELFFGREALVAELVTKVEQAPFLAVMGASGSGKSSVVRAGLIPELKAGALPGSERWRYVTITPGSTPVDQLAVALGKLQGGDLGSVLALSRQLAENDRALQLAAAMLLDGRGDGRLVIVVDQAEELWTLAPADPEACKLFVESQQRPFVRRILGAAQAKGAGGRSPVLTIVTMRADFLHRAAEYQDLAQLISDHLQVVSPLAPDELRHAITGPAELVGCGFEPGLVDELVQQVEGQPGALPLLQYTLLELWKQRLPDGTLTWEAFRGLGGVDGALAARADAILRERYPTPEAQEELRRALLRLVQPGEGAADTRRRALLRDMAPAGSGVADVQALLKPLADERLLTTGRDAASGAETIEVAHEALIRAWPTFGRWIGEARGDLRLQLQLEEAAREWEAHEQADDYLWGGLRLAQAEAWIERARPGLNQRDQAFVAASHHRERAEAEAEEAARVERERLLEERAEAERRNASRLRIFLAAAAALLAVMVGLAALALWFWNGSVRSERLARGQQYAAQGELVSAEDPRLGLRLMLEGAALMDDAEKERETLMQRLRDKARQAIVQRRPGPFSSFVSSADGSRIVVGRGDRPGELLGMDQGRLVALAPLGANLSIAEFSGDPQARFFTVQYSDTAELRRSADGALITRFEMAPGTTLRFSRDREARFVMVLGGEAVELRRSDTGEPVPLGGQARMIWISPDAEARYMVVSYLSGAAELRAAGGESTPLKGRAENVVFSRDPAATYLGLLYPDDETVELRESATGRVIRSFEGVSWGSPLAFSGDPAAALFAFGGNLVRTSSGEPVPLEAGANTVSFSSWPEARYFVVAYDGGRYELRRLEDGAVVPLDPAPEGIWIEAGESARWFHLAYEDHEELYRLDSGAAGPRQEGQFINVSYSPYPAVPFATINEDRGRLGLWRTDTGLFVQSLGTYWQSTYWVAFNGATAAGTVLVTSRDAESAIWELGAAPRRLANLGLGLRYHAVSADGRQLVAQYDDRIDVLDIDWLRAQAAEEQLTDDEVVRLACDPARAGGVTTGELDPYLASRPPQACKPAAAAGP